MSDDERAHDFLLRLSRLSSETGIYITSCGECESMWLLNGPQEPGRYPRDDAIIVGVDYDADGIYSGKSGGGSAMRERDAPQKRSAE